MNQTAPENQLEDAAVMLRPAKANTRSKSALLRLNIPDNLLNYEPLNKEISALLPRNYNFEIHKTIDQIHKFNAKRVALQLPEGLQMFATAICSILEKCSYQKAIYDGDAPLEPLDTVILADVTYGACCVDDYTAKQLDCDYMVHYGHSCLIPISKTLIKVLYVFVDISFDISHLLETIKYNFSPNEKLVMMATIQFSSSLQQIVEILREQGYMDLHVPQIKPLSPGEVLGCTSPRLLDKSKVLYLGDGRFHLESMMIANPHLDGLFYRYDPYSATLTREYYAMHDMLVMRKEAILAARKPSAKRFCIVLGTLGRQGSVNVMEWLQDSLKQAGKDVLVVLMSELSPAKIKAFENEKHIDVWIQTSCPRLSIDWGYGFNVPLLTPYEAMLCLLPEVEWETRRPKWLDACDQQSCSKLYQDWEMYPMDFYAHDSLGKWTPNHKEKDDKKDNEAAAEKKRLLKERLKALRSSAK
ncbi:hypothetical protein MP638_005777 [Amoeboaphelidium occidentale]|nr:hypothetical protein MP638_005777 [Amoeboaphelidium occidentale]